MSERILSADPNLHEALATTAHLNDLGLDAYTQNGAVLVAEVAARAAAAEAVTNRIRLLRDLLRENLGEKPLFLSSDLDSRYSVELVRLLTSITGGSNVEA